MTFESLARGMHFVTIKKDIRRFDRGELEKPVRLENGWMRVDGFISREGLLEYSRSDGSSWVEYRPPEEAFAPAMLESFASVPLTNNHPPSGFLDADNTKMYQVGTVETPKQDGKFVRARMLVTDASAISAMEKGKAELSCGYLCDLDFSPGEVDGKRYDAIQRNVRGNHVALVAAGRAGPEVRVRVDSANAEVLPLHAINEPRKDTMLKIKIDGVEFEVSETVAQAFEKHQKAQGEIIAGVTARADAAEADVKKVQAELAAAPEKIRAEITARVDLETKARNVLGPDEKFDGKGTLEIQTAVAEKVLGLKMDGKAEAYVAACFDLALVRLDSEGSEALASAREASIGKPRTDSDPAEVARQKFLEASRNAHRKQTK